MTERVISQKQAAEIG